MEQIIGLVSKSLSGSFYTGTLTNNTAYNIICTNSVGSASDSVTINVNSQPPSPQGPTVTLTANPPSIQYGGSSVLVWNSTNATSCSGSGTNNFSTSGSMVVSPLTTTTYSITCVGTGRKCRGYSNSCCRKSNFSNQW